MLLSIIWVVQDPEIQDPGFWLDIVLEYYVLSGWYPASVALLEVQASGVPEAGWPA
jgi:hypothetical protein